MGAEIDRLEVQIEASASRANAELNKLVNKLDRVASSLSGINSKGLIGFANGIEKLGRSMQTVSSVKVTDFTRIVNGINKFASVDIQKIGEASRAISILTTDLSRIGMISINSQGLSDLAGALAKLGYKTVTQAVDNIPRLTAALMGLVESLNSVGSVGFDLEGLRDLVSSIAKLGGKASTNAIPNIRSLGDALKQLITTLSTVPQVSNNVIALTNALANLASNGNRVSTATARLSRGLNLVSSSARTATKSTSGITFAVGKLYATYWVLIRAFGKFKKAIDISSDLTEVQNIVDVTFGNMKRKVEDLASTSIADFGMSELTVKQISSRFQAMGVAMGFTQDRMSDMSIELTKLAADMASFYNIEQEAVAEDLESIFTGQTRPLRTYGLDLTQATLQEWAMKQGIDANVQAMSQAEKTLLRYQYVLANTGAAQGDFARTSGTWANQIRILQQQFQALASVIGGVLINALKPFVVALNNVMSKVIQFAQTVANALGAIFGWTIEIDSGGMTNDFGDIADSTGDAAGNLGNAADAAKKLKTLVRGIDELNILSPDDSEPGNGGGNTGTGIGGGAGGAGSANLVKVESAFDKYKSEIQNLFQLGEYIGQALTDVMNSIDWESIYAGARNFGKGLADFLNGLISPELFGAVGRTIAGALNTAVYSALSFGITFDWEDLGLSIATGINEFFNTFDFEALAQTLNTWVDGIEKAISKALENLDWNSIMSGLGKFFSNLEIDTVAAIIGVLTIRKIGKLQIGKALDQVIGTSIATWIAGKGKSIASALGTAIAGIFSQISLSSIAGALGAVFSSINPGLFGEVFISLEQFTAGTWLDTNTWTGIPASIHNAIVAVIDAIGQAVSEGATILGSTLKEFLGGIFNWDSTMAIFEDARANFEKGGLYIIQGVLEGIVGAVGFIVEPIGDFFVGLWNAICDVFGIHSPAEEMKPLGEYILLGVVEGFKGKISDFSEAVSDWYENSVKPWFTIEKWEELFSNINTAFLGKMGEWKENAIAFVTEKVPEIPNKIAEFFEELPDKFSEIGKNIISGLWQGMQEGQGVLKKGAGDICLDLVGNFRENLDINSPSRVFAEIGNYAILGLVGAFTDSGIVKEQIYLFTESLISIFREQLSPENFALIAENAMFAFVEAFNMGFQNMQLASGESMLLLSTSVVNTLTLLNQRISVIFTAIAVMIQQKWALMLNQTRLSWTQINNLVSQNLDVLNTKLVSGMTVANMNWSAKWDQFVERVRNACAEVENAVSNLSDSVKNMCDSMMSAIRAVKDAASSMGSISVSGGSVRGFASGGYPETGELFMARENGINEMVGRIGNRSAVANNDQIVEAIRAAVVQGINADEQNALLREQNALLRAILDKDTDVSLDGRSLVDGIDKARKRMGVNFQPA